MLRGNFFGLFKAVQKQKTTTKKIQNANNADNTYSPSCSKKLKLLFCAK